MQIVQKPFDILEKGFLNFKDHIVTFILIPKKA